MVLTTMLENALVHRFQLLQMHLAISLRFPRFHSAVILHVHGSVHRIQVVTIGLVDFVDTGALTAWRWTSRNVRGIDLSAGRWGLCLLHHDELVGVESLTLRHIDIHVYVDRQELARTVLKL